MGERPLGCKTPITLQGRVETRITLPMGFSVPKRFSATVCPRTQTAALRSTLFWSKVVPEASSHFLIWRNSGVTPRKVVPQLVLP